MHWFVVRSQASVVQTLLSLHCVPLVQQFAIAVFVQVLVERSHASAVQTLLSLHWVSLVQQPLTATLLHMWTVRLQVSVVQTLLSLHCDGVVQQPTIAVCVHVPLEHPSVVQMSPSLHCAAVVQASASGPDHVAVTTAATSEQTATEVREDRRLGFTRGPRPRHALPAPPIPQQAATIRLQSRCRGDARRSAGVSGPAAADGRLECPVRYTFARACAQVGT